jgi:hypothetical protein
MVVKIALWPVEIQSLNVTIDSMNKFIQNTYNTHTTNGFMGHTHIITTTKKDKITFDPEDNWFFLYHFYRKGDENLRTLVGDQFLKKVGIFGDVLMAESICDYFENKYPDPKEANNHIQDYFGFRSCFENEDADDRKNTLNPSFLERIERYLYNFEEQPKHIDKWDWPIEELRRLGLANELLNLKQ